MKYALAICAILICSYERAESRLDNYHSSEEIERIVGGQPADIRKFPYLVSLRHLGTHNCGASIISAKHCLTAAHCFKEKSFEYQYSILAGSTAKSGLRSLRGVNVKVLRFIRHERFTDEPPVNDIAVLVLARLLPLNGDTIRIAPLPLRNQALPFGKIGHVAGWGNTIDGDDNSISVMLRALEKPVLMNSICQRAYGSIFQVPIMMCAGYIYGGRDTCQGDSGGPLTVDRHVIGIVSFGKGCGEPKFPGIYTNVAVFVIGLIIFCNRHECLIIRVQKKVFHRKE